MQTKRIHAKRFMAMFLTLVMLLSLMPTAVFAADAETLAPESEQLTLTAPQTQESEPDAPALAAHAAPAEPETDASAEAAEQEAAEEAEVSEPAEAPADDAAAQLEEAKQQLMTMPRGGAHVVLAAEATDLAEGTYTVPITGLDCAAPLDPVKEAFAKAFGTSLQLNVDAEGKLTATITPQHMVVEMFGASYHCNVLTVEGATYPEMQTVQYNPGMVTNLETIEAPKTIVKELPDASGTYTMSLTVDFMNALLGKGNPYPTDVTLTLDLSGVPTREETTEPEVPEQPGQPEGPSYAFGSQQTVLNPGHYNLPIAMVKADGSDASSMASAAVKSATLDVLETGDAYVNVKLGSVTVMFIKGWASDWKIFQEYNTKSSLAPATVVTTDDQSHVTEIRFKLPFTDQDGVYAQMSISPVNMTQEALLKLNFAGAIPAAPVVPEKPEVPEYDASNNEAAILDAEGKTVGGADLSTLEAGAKPFAEVPNGGKVVLQKDVTTPDSVSLYLDAAEGVSYTLDLNGHTFNATHGMNLSTAAQNNTVTVIDSKNTAVVNYSKANPLAAPAGSKIILNGGTWNVEGILVQGITTVYKGQVEIRSGHFNCADLQNGGIGTAATTKATGGDFNFDVSEPNNLFYMVLDPVPHDTHDAYEKDGRWYVVPLEEMPQAEVKTGTAEVVLGSEKAYDVTAEVSVLDGAIQDVVLSHNAAESGHANSKSFADKAMGMADSFKNLNASDKEAIEAVDGVSGATFTSNAYRTAVLKALDLYTEPQAPDFTFGAAGTELQPGVYNVPVVLRQETKHDTASVAKDAFAPTAKLTVNEDGTAVLETTMGIVSMGAISDMAYDVLIFQEDNTESDTVPATVLESIIKEAPLINPGVEVPTKISFTIPNNDWDGVYVNFTVDAMGPAYPNGWLLIDYAKATEPGSAQHFQGSAKVNQFGKYTIHTDVTVTDGLISNVDVTADSFISETHRPTNEMKIAQVTKALKDAWNGIAPTQENAEKIFKTIMKPDAPDEVIDGVSGATYSARAVRDAVMDAFDLEYQDEIINVPESVEPGVYKVEIGYYSDVVWHSLIENVKNEAILTVAEDGTMTLSFDTLSGTDKEPLYILGFNGIYPNNDKSQALTKEGTSVTMGLSSNDYEDENFAKGTQVVTHLSFPLQGGLTKIYTTNAYLYVPAMKALNGNLSGVEFENGKFNVDVFAKIYWDTMVKTDETPEPPAPPVPEETQHMTASMVVLVENQDKPSMCNPLFDQNVDITISGDVASVRFLVANPVPAFTNDGADGTVKNFTLHYEGQDYVAKSDMDSKPSFTADVNGPLFGINAGDELTAQVLTVELPKDAIVEGAVFVASAFVNVVMKNDVYMRVQLSDLKAEEVKPLPPAPPADTEYYVADLTILNETKDTPSMSDAMFAQEVGVAITGDQAELTIKVAYPVPNFPDDGKDGTVKDFTVMYNGQAYVASSDITSEATMTVKANNPMFGLVKGSEVTAQTLTLTLPAAALENSILPGSAYVNVVMHTIVDFRVQLTNYTPVGQPSVPETETARPEITPYGGKFEGSVQVTLKAEDGAVIYYTTDGSEPTENSQKYTGPFTLTESATVKAAAKAEGKLMSQVASVNFTKVVPVAAAPTISPAGQNFSDSIQVTLKAEEGASIYYTTDGSNPAEKGQKYTGPITLTETATVKAVAKVSGKTVSPVAAATFTKITPDQGVQLKDGKYYVDIALWHERKDEPSMGNKAFEGNKALVTVSGGKVTSMQVATSPVNMGGIISAVTDISVNGRAVNVIKRAPITTSEGNDIQFIQLFSFSIPDAAQPKNGDVAFVPIQFLVPDTPMGNERMDARLKIMWNTAKSTGDGSIAVPDKPVVPGVDEHPAVNLEDKATGIKIHADAGVFQENVKLVVTPISESDAAYKKAAEDLKSISGKFVLYEVHFVNDKGQEVQPQGTVTVSYPVPKDFDSAQMAVYRINDSGKPTKINGAVNGKYYEVVQKSFSQYAVVDLRTADSAAPETATPTGDSTPVLALMGLMALSGAAIVVLLRKKREQ